MTTQNSERGTGVEADFEPDRIGEVGSPGFRRIESRDSGGSLMFDAFFVEPGGLLELMEAAPAQPM